MLRLLLILLLRKLASLLLRQFHRKFLMLYLRLISYCHQNLCQFCQFFSVLFMSVMDYFYAEYLQRELCRNLRRSTKHGKSELLHPLPSSSKPTFSRAILLQRKIVSFDKVVYFSSALFFCRYELQKDVNCH